MGQRKLEKMMKLLLVTGASAGIGTKTAEHFLADGYSAVNLSRRRCPNRTTGRHAIKIPRSLVRRSATTTAPRRRACSIIS